MDITENKTTFNKYFLDTEFIEKPGSIELISIGIVNNGTGEDSRAYYAISNEFNVKEVWDNDWLRENVLKQIFTDIKESKRIKSEELDFTIENAAFIIAKFGKSKKEIASEIIDFVGKNPKFYGWYCDYDWVVFCWLFGRMIDLPKGFPMYMIDLKQFADLFQFNKDYVNSSIPENKREHHALCDAIRERNIYWLMVNTINSSDVSIFGKITKDGFFK